MPINSILVVSAVVLMFGIFAAVLTWADIQTRPVPPAGQIGKSKQKRRSF